jgi:hypothetical protein
MIFKIKEFIKNLFTKNLLLKLIAIIISVFIFIVISK